MISSRVQAATAGLTLLIFGLGGCSSTQESRIEKPRPHYPTLADCCAQMMPLAIKEVEHRLTENGWTLHKLPQLRDIKPRFGSNEEFDKWLTTWLPIYEHYIQELEGEKHVVHPLTFESSPYIINSFLSESIVKDELRSVHYLKTIEKKFTHSDLEPTRLDRFVDLMYRLDKGIIVKGKDEKSLYFIGSEEGVDRVLQEIAHQ